VNSPVSRSFFGRQRMRAMRLPRGICRQLSSSTPSSTGSLGWMGSYLLVLEREARAAAKAAEAEIIQGRWRGPLHGIPFAVKDRVCGLAYPTGQPAIPSAASPQVARFYSAQMDWFYAAVDSSTINGLTQNWTSRWGPVHRLRIVEHVYFLREGGRTEAWSANERRGSLAER
jgi:hypothetical protein